MAEAGRCGAWIGSLRCRLPLGHAGMHWSQWQEPPDLRWLAAQDLAEDYGIEVDPADVVIETVEEGDG